VRECQSIWTSWRLHTYIAESKNKNRQHEQNVKPLFSGFVCVEGAVVVLVMRQVNLMCFAVQSDRYRVGISNEDLNTQLELLKQKIDAH
jgi:hypothetical protein